MASVPPPVAAVTGAAGGLGGAFARALASSGYQLILTDRDSPGLEALARDLGNMVRVDTEVADLTATADLATFAGRLAGVELLVNNAGFGTYSMFADADLERQIAMVRLHVEAAMTLTHAALPGMIATGRGAVINVASAGAFLRFPRDATYIGTKSFLVAFTECLAIELVETGVSVQALCPAWVRTGFADVGEYAAAAYRSPIPEWLFISPEEVVSASLAALGHSVICIPARRARFAVALLGSRPGRAGLAYLRARRRRLDQPSAHGSP